jgi:PAS domain S-box-containing protein
VKNNELLDNLPFGVIVTDNQHNLKYYNNYVSIQISSDVSMLETELSSVPIGKNRDSNKARHGIACISINAQIFNVKYYEIKLDNDIDETEWIFLLHESNDFFDIKNEMDEAKEQIDLFQSIIDFSYDGIYVTDHMGTTLFANSSYERITGVKLNEVVGRNISELELVGMFSPIITPWVLENKHGITIEQRVRTGKKVVITGNPVFDEAGNIRYVITNVRDMAEIQQLRDEVSRLKQERELGSDHIIYRSSAMSQVLQTISIVADINISILLLGESGVGKEIVAKHIHEISDRKNEPFVTVNCGALVPTLLESELFGYEAGSFTGASKKGKHGLFEAADKGIIFLDEIGDMSLELQGRLLRVLQEREIQRVGGTEQIPIDVRVVCATNKNLAQMVSDGTFREDLFYRLDVVTIEIPPLRERKDDIGLLIASFIEQFNQKYLKTKTFSTEAIQLLIEYRWPGNVRELKNLVEQLIVLSPQDEIGLKDLPPKIMVDFAKAPKTLPSGTFKLILEAEKGSQAEYYARFLHLATSPLLPFVVFDETDFYTSKQEGMNEDAERIQQKMLHLDASSGGTVFLNYFNTWNRELQKKWIIRFCNREYEQTEKRYNVILSVNTSVENAIASENLDRELIRGFSIIDLTKALFPGKDTVILKKIRYYLEEFELKYNIKKQISENAISALCDHCWTNTDEELKAVIENMVLEEEQIIDLFNLPDELIKEYKRDIPPVEVHRIIPLRDAVKSVEIQMIDLAMKKYKTTRRAAAALGITQPSIVRKKNRPKTDQFDK